MSDYNSVANAEEIVRVAICRLELHEAVRDAISTAFRNSWNSWNAAPNTTSDAASGGDSADTLTEVRHIDACDQHPGRLDGATTFKIASWEETTDSLYPGADGLRGSAQRLGVGVFQAAWYAVSGPDNSLPLPIQI